MRRNNEASMIIRTLVRSAAALVCGAAMLWAPVQAGIFRSYLSSAGNDANPCTLPAPCRLLPAALAAVNDGGEIWLLDSANFNTATVSVAKSVTIIAIPGVLGSIVANGADALSINAPGAKVTLRNVAIVNLSGVGNKGVAFLQGATLVVEGSQLYGLGTGVMATAAGATVTIKDTTIRDNDTGVTFSTLVRGQLVHVALLNNLTAGVSALNGARVTMSGSTVSGGGSGVVASASSSSTTQVAISASSLSGNSVAVQVAASTVSDASQVVLNNVTIAHNSSGVSISGAATAVVYTRQNNTFMFNVVDVPSGSLTVLVPQ
jgi:hypothetical protein